MSDADRYAPSAPERAEPPNHPASSSTWLERNWKWFVPLGCGGALLVFAAFAATIVGFVFWLIRSNNAYVEALERARTFPAVIEALGDPVEPGFWVSGKINTSGPSGEADLMFPITGPRGRGTVYLEATKAGGVWDFERLEVEIEESGERIDLLQSREGHGISDLLLFSARYAEVLQQVWIRRVVRGERPI